MDRQSACLCASAEVESIFLGRALLFVRPCPPQTRSARKPTCMCRQAVKTLQKLQSACLLTAQALYL